MKITQMKKSDFKEIPFREPYTNIGAFASLVIIPTRRMHDSGWACMEYVAVDRDDEPICKFGGCSDVLHMDGIGGRGRWNGISIPTDIRAKGWTIDCLPCGYLRLWSKFKLTTDEFCVSDAEIYSEESLGRVND